MKKNKLCHSNEGGFALITAIMMLFAATVMGLMVMNSSEMEILLSGAQQRYEQSFNVTEGASNMESVILDNDLTVNTRRYAVSDPSLQNQMISPNNYGNLAQFDPYGNLTADPGLPDPDTVDKWSEDPNKWPSDRVIAADNTQAYRYMVTYKKWDAPRKGYDSTTKGQVCEYDFKIAVTNWNITSQTYNAWIETGNSRMGPRPN